MKATRILSMVLALAMVFALALSGSALADGAVPEVLRVGTSEELGQLLPNSAAGECGVGDFLVYDMIFYYDADNNLTSDIIDDYHFEDDGFTLVMNVREGVTFSSGNPLTGEDVLFTLASAQEPDRQAIKSDFELFDFENSYVSDDGYTVYLKTFDTATAVSQFSMLIQVPVLDKAWVEENGWTSELWYTAPSGSGPYGVADYLTGNTYTFALRDDWWMADAGIEYPNEITLTAYAEKSTMYIDLENGSIDLAIEPSSEDFVRSQDEGDNIEGVFINGNVCNWIVFDVEDPDSATYDIEVRKAIAHGVDWEQIAVAGKGVMWDPATSSIPSYFPDYIDLGQYEYDPELARQILADAGYADGDINLYMVISTNAQATGPVLQAYLADIGINFTFDAFDIPTAVPLWIEGEGDISTFAMMGGSAAHDPYWVYKELASTATMKDNQTVTDTTIDDCLAKALVAETEEEAHEYYVQIQQWIYDTYRIVPYFEEVNGACFNSDIISSVQFNSKQMPDLRNIVYAG